MSGETALDLAAEAVERFPFLRYWPAVDAIKGARLLSRLPDEEHAHVAAILERVDVDLDTCNRIIRNLPTVPPDERAAIYAAAESGDPVRAINAITVAAANPPHAEPALLLGLHAERALKAWRERLVKIEEHILAARVEKLRSEADGIRESLEGRKVRL